MKTCSREIKFNLTMTASIRNVSRWKYETSENKTNKSLSVQIFKALKCELQLIHFLINKASHLTLGIMSSENLMAPVFLNYLI